MKTGEQVELSCVLEKDTPSNREILIAILGSHGYDSFEEREECLRAYLPETRFNPEILAGIQDELKAVTGFLRFSHTRLAEKNWNEEWEKHFEPVVIDEKCLIRAHFHPEDNGFPYEIVLTPKMSFGTGHHASTALMISHMLRLDLRDKRILDMGCGTGILSVLAEKMGAESIVAVDNNDWAVENARENLDLNQCSRTEVLNGDASLLSQLNNVDLILANISRNTLLEDMGAYASLASPGSLLLTGGYFSLYEDQITQTATDHGYEWISTLHRDKWSGQLFRKTGR